MGAKYDNMMQHLSIQYDETYILGFCSRIMEAASLTIYFKGVLTTIRNVSASRYL